MSRTAANVGPAHRAGRRHATARDRRRRWPPAGVAAVVLALVTGPTWGFWTTTAHGSGVAATGTLDPPTGLTATVAQWSSTAHLTWQAPAGGVTPDGYVVTRVQDGATAAACGTAPAQPTTELECVDTGVPDGQHHYLVTAVQESWTAVGGPSGTVTVLEDSAAPTASVTSVTPAANENGWHRSSPVVLAIGASDDGPSGVASITYRIDGGPPTTVSGETASVSVGGDGVHTVTYVATDEAGNPGSPSDETVRIDSAAPAVAVARAEGQGDPTRSSPITYTVVFSEPVTGFDDEDVVLSGTAGASTASVTGTGSTYSVAVTGMSADGTVVLSIGDGAAVDVAGNGNAASSGPGGTVTRDTTPPSAPSAPVLTAASDTGASSSDRITRDNTPTFTGTAEAGATVTLYDGTQVAGSGQASGGTYSITTSSLVDGNHVLTATATDAADNTGAPSGSATVTIDTAAPDAPAALDLVTGSDSFSTRAPGTTSTDNITNDTTPTFTGTAVAGTAVTAYSNATAVGTTSAPSGSFTVTAGVLAEGPQTVTATATDIAGNTSLHAPGVAVTIDSVAPAVSITTSSYSSATGRISMSGAAGALTGDASTLGVVICANDSWPCSSFNTRWADPAVAASTGAWAATSSDLRTCVLVCLPPGDVYIRATQTDHAGNISEPTLFFTDS